MRERPRYGTTAGSRLGGCGQLGQPGQPGHLRLFGLPGQPGRLRLFGLLALFLLASTAACARTVSPEGGPVPETPLQVVESDPEPFAVIEPFGDPIRIGFDRRVSERPLSGQLRDAVVVSPRTGEISVRHRRRGIEIQMDGGFRERTVYRVTLLPTVQDLWRNPLADAHDLFFSTGPEFEPNVLGGLVVDRLTGEEVGEARVDAIPVDAGPVHSTVTDSLGIFTFPYLPADRYTVRAYRDMNRNREADFSEPQDSVGVELSRGDTLIVGEMHLLLPDTTPAVVTRAEALDSMTVRVVFDDPLDPEQSLDGVDARLAREDGAAPGVAEILHLHEWEERVAEEEPAEPEPGDPDDPDAPPPPPPEPAPAAPEGPLLPAFEVVLILDGPLEPEVTYTVGVDGVVNLNEVPGGGGEAEVTGPVPPVPVEPPGDDPPDPIPPDTVPPLANAVSPAPDTIPRPPGTAGSAGRP